jgi:hypothetical protein
LGQAVEDALGPIKDGVKKKSKKLKSTMSSSSSNSNHFKEEDDDKVDDGDDDGITVEDYDDDDDDDDDDDESSESDSKERRRRRLLHSEYEDDLSSKEKAKRIYDQECHEGNSKTLIDLGVVNPSLKFVGGDLTLGGYNFVITFVTTSKRLYVFTNLFRVIF